MLHPTLKLALAVAPAVVAIAAGVVYPNFPHAVLYVSGVLEAERAQQSGDDLVRRMEANRVPVAAHVPVAGPRPGYDRRPPVRNKRSGQVHYAPPVH